MHDCIRQLNPRKKQASHYFFLPNFQGFLVRPIGVVWGQKKFLGGHLASGTKLLGHKQKLLGHKPQIVT